MRKRREESGPVRGQGDIKNEEGRRKCPSRFRIAAGNLVEEDSIRVRRGRDDNEKKRHRALNLTE